MTNANVSISTATHIRNKQNTKGLNDKMCAPKCPPFQIEIYPFMNMPRCDMSKLQVLKKVLGHDLFDLDFLKTCLHLVSYTMSCNSTYLSTVLKWKQDIKFYTCAPS